MLPLPPSNLSEFLHGLAAQSAEHPAAIGEHDTLTFAGLDAAADAWAHALRAAGCERGCHVGLLAGNGPAWLAAAFGVWRAGATLVPISTFVTGRELAEILEHADVTTLIVQSQLRGHDYLAMLRQQPALPKLRQVIELRAVLPHHVESVGAGEADVPAGSPGNKSPGSVEQSRLKPTPKPFSESPSGDFLGDSAGEFIPRRWNSAEGGAAESIACILYTSGTTGQPKGVMLSHGAILATVLPTAERTGLSSADSLLSTLPLFWVAGLVIRALPTLATGCALILMETFTVDALIGMLRRHRPTALHLRPPQVGQLLAHPQFDADLLARVHRGGGRVEWYAPHLRDARLITGYGMTEMAGYVTALHWQDDAEVRRSQLGALLPGVEVRIADDVGHPVPSGDVGEIRVRGPGMFNGYHRQPAGTGVDGDGFFLTGDLGCIDAAGVLHFVGRSKDLLRVKGINVSPLEVEAVLASHPAVEAAYVVGLPPDGLDQYVAALIVVKPDVQLTEAPLRALADAMLSHYKRPEHYVFIERSDVPLSGTVKPQRLALAELAAKRLRGSTTDPKTKKPPLSQSRKGAKNKAPRADPH